MIILKAVGIVIAGLLAVLICLLTLVSLIKAGVRITLQSGEKAQIRIRVCGILFGGKPKKEKKEKPPKKEKKTKPKKKKTFSELMDLLSLGLKLLKIILKRLPWLLGRVRVKKLHIDCVTADADAADAALLYGGACAVIYPLLDLMQDNMRVDKNAVEATIRCDFEAENPSLYLDAEISLRVFHALRFAFHVLFRKILSDLEDTIDESTTKKQ